VRALLADAPELAHASGAHNIPVMFYPAISGRVDILELLYGAGAEVNFADGLNSPLHGAAIFGQTEAVAWLLAHDANPYATDYEGKTPLDRAEENRHEAAAALLRPFIETAD
jgi:ankyrin repeat protein